MPSSVYFALESQFMTSMTFRKGLAVVASVPLAACASAPSESLSETAWGETSVVEELRIGVDDGSRQHMFGDIQSLAVAPSGTIYVGERQPISRPKGIEVLIRAYDADGHYLFDVGRIGEGPGEYEFASPSALPDGRLAVWDMRNRRVSLYSPDGDYDGSVSADGSLGTLRTDAAGNLYVEAQAMEAGRPQRVLKKYSIEGELLDTIPVPSNLPDPADPWKTDFILGPEGGIRPFTAMTRWALSPLGYLAVGQNDRYNIKLQKATGTVHLTRDLEAIPVQPAERAEWNGFRARVIRQNAERGIGAEILPIPNRKPYFRKLYAGEMGRIWVFRYVMAEKRDDISPLPGRPDRPLLTWREPFTYDAFEPDGTFLGSVVLAEDFEPHVFRGMRIWGTWTGNDGVVQIVRLRVVTEAERQ